MKARRRRIDRRPTYVRILRLRRIQPGGVMCFVLFEGSILFAALLSMAELVSWWSVLVLPTAVALMVKINDMVAKVPGRDEQPRRTTLAEGVRRITSAGGARQAASTGGGRQATSTVGGRQATSTVGGRPEVASEGTLTEPEIIRAARRASARRFN